MPDALMSSSGTRCQRRTHRRNGPGGRGSLRFRALLESFDGSFLVRGRRRGTRLRLTRGVLRDRSFALHHSYRGAFPPRGFFHRGFASQVPPHE